MSGSTVVKNQYNFNFALSITVRFVSIIMIVSDRDSDMKYKQGNVNLSVCLHGLTVVTPLTALLVSSCFFWRYGF